MGSSLRTPETYANAEQKWQVLTCNTQQYSTLVCHQWCTITEWRVISETCRSGLENCRKLLLAKLVAEMHRYRDMYRARVQDLECLVSHFNAASELFEEETDEGHGIAALEFRSLLEAYQCLSDIIDLQRRHELGLF